jgi:uncharacterized protein with von Willebrand factor type A (vWA) domain
VISEGAPRYGGVVSLQSIEGEDGKRVWPDASRAQRSDLAHNVIDFVRLLRANGLPASPAEVHDVVRGLCFIDLGDRHEFYLTLRSILLWNPDQQPLFDELFERFWGGWADEETMIREDRAPTMQSAQSERVESQSSDATYSAMEALIQKDFSDFKPEELGAVARACVAIARRVATRKSRRYRITTKGSRIDPRRTIRRNVKYGGTILELSKLERKIRKPRIVVICDVSRSMEQYSIFLLQFMHSMQNVIGRIESFVFSTALHRVSSYFKHSDIQTALDDIAREIPDWSGGTRIGESLKTFNDQFARRLVDQRTVVIILSDGLDTGQTELLDEEMAKLHLRCARLIWLNPLLGKDHYQPVARGMAAALPHVDVFAAAHNLASLQKLANSLATPRAPRPAFGALAG